MSLTLIGGMLDTRINPTRIDAIARGHSQEWFDQHAITMVSPLQPGHGRRVYSGNVEWLMLSTYLLRHCACGGELLGKILYDDVRIPLDIRFLGCFSQSSTCLRNSLST
jgi:poly(3-hydroxybutyrate) depolymerase